MDETCGEEGDFEIEGRAVREFVGEGGGEVSVELVEEDFFVTRVVESPTRPFTGSAIVFAEGVLFDLRAARSSIANFASILSFRIFCASANAFFQIADVSGSFMRLESTQTSYISFPKVRMTSLAISGCCSRSTVLSRSGCASMSG